MDQVKELRKKFLKQLPIWDKVNELRVELEKLSYDINYSLKTIQEDGHRLDVRISKLNLTDKRICHPPKQHIESDLIKYYSLAKDGTCIIIPDKEIGDQGKRLFKDSNVGDSLELLESRLYHNEEVFAMIKPGQPWQSCKIRSVVYQPINGRPSTTIKLNLVTDNGIKVFSAKKYAVARAQCHGDKLRSSKRVIAGYSESNLRPGIIGQDPSLENNHCYLVLFDDGTALYFKPNQVYPICYQSCIPWKDYRFLTNQSNLSLEVELLYFFRMYPRRHLLQARKGLRFEIFRHGMIVPARVVAIDRDVLKIAYEDDSEEYIYAGSVRILKRDFLMTRLTITEIGIDKLHYKIIGHMKRYHEAGVKAVGEEYLKWVENFTQPISVVGRTARKSTSHQYSPPRFKVKLDNPLVPDDRVSCPALQELIDNTEHKRCTPNCLDIPGKRTESCIENIEEEFRNVSDIMVPLMLGWTRMLVLSAKGKKVYVYKSPCGRILNTFLQVKNYLKQTQTSKLDLDFFSFEREVQLNRPQDILDVYYHDPNIAKDKQGKPLERKFISLVNPSNEERLPLDFEYRNETFPHPMLRSRGFSFNTEFKSGCDCDDDCSMRSSCACHQLNEQAAGTNAHNKGSVDQKCQYSNKRLMIQVSTGIFECNEFCSCSSKCPNRVVQNGIRVRLQVRKTVSKGWGVFTLDDIPKGAFVSTYAAELLDDADQYGADDMYFADLDYISIVEEAKRALDEDEKSDEGVISDGDDSDDLPAQPNDPVFNEFMPRYPRRNRTCRPSNAQGAGRPRPVYKPIFELLNETSDTYTLDARMQGNIGRFFNHSCDPNTFVQNVFITTHDLRFPVVAFFTKKAIKSGDEITWNYNYKIDSIAGRQIICNCGAPNCKGRIL